MIYAHKSGRGPEWARTLLEASPGFVPPECKVQLILDVLDYPESLEATAASSVPSWGVQIFGSAEVFADPARARVFQEQVSQIRGTIEERGRQP